ncbi:hypothetical protein BKA93DRAFT_115715 [Sparassis latifolia]|uniref:Uncharacterized protein n=1 Tax=Sparassis crispa TaxID=139825 RepID=A0A401GDJ7_9APHY|nr:hypothetical protein SCP_0214030 [Sparassis crispa]GBE80193.1 hypothetical protein SCP_0214030 [Sparassis crispa]
MVKRQRSSSCVATPHKVSKLDTSLQDGSSWSGSPHIASGFTLPELLDFTSLESDHAICSRFDNIASALFHEYRLLAASPETRTEFEILEVEFYLHKSSCHEDPFTHGSDEQKQSGNWYFHRAPRKARVSQLSVTAAGGYRGGTRKGLDLTIGAPATPKSRFFTESTSQMLDPPLLRGGVLLRTLRRMSDSTIISGPSLLVDELLRVSEASNIAKLVTDKWSGDTSAFLISASSETRTTCLHLVHVQPSRTQSSATIYRSPRIGLELSHPDITLERLATHPRVVYVAKPYRYFIRPHLLTANGRAQTFLGVYHACMDSKSFTQDSELCYTITRITGLKAPTVVKYLGEYNHGLAKGSLTAFIGAAGKGVSASPTRFLRMMGTLRKVSTEQENHS